MVLRRSEYLHHFVWYDDHNVNIFGYLSMRCDKQHNEQWTRWWVSCQLDTQFYHFHSNVIFTKRYGTHMPQYNTQTLPVSMFRFHGSRKNTNTQLNGIMRLLPLSLSHKYSQRNSQNPKQWYHGFLLSYNGDLGLVCENRLFFFLNHNYLRYMSGHINWVW